MRFLCIMVVVAVVDCGMPVMSHSPIDDRARNVRDRGICAVYLGMFTYEDWRSRRSGPISTMRAIDDNKQVCSRP